MRGWWFKGAVLLMGTVCRLRAGTSCRGSWLGTGMWEFGWLLGMQDNADVAAAALCSGWSVGWLTSSLKYLGSMLFGVASLM